MISVLYLETIKAQRDATASIKSLPFPALRGWDRHTRPLARDSVAQALIIVAFRGKQTLENLNTQVCML